jgi:probable selenium-dependent hydroxylase accessory protein YqeC
MHRPFEAFHITGRFISVIGSGGKTTLLRYLSRRLPGTVILTTSTHMYPFADMPLVDVGGEATPANRRRVTGEIRAALAAGRAVCLGRLLPSGKLSDPSAAIPFETLLAEADYVVAEADGSAGRPLKAHRPFEPVIPACSVMTVGVAGASGIGRPASEACHCPELFCALAGMDPGEPVRPEHVAAVLNREALADCWLVNQMDVLPDPGIARQLCEIINGDAFPCSLGR